MTNNSPVRILVVDDHPILREGIALVIKSQSELELVGEAPTGREAIQQFRRYRPDVTLMDLGLPDMSGIDALIAIRDEFRDARIIILTAIEGDFKIRRALLAGARGYLLKTMPPTDMVEAIRRVHEGKKYVPPAVALQLEHLDAEILTERETEILQQIACGYRTRDIAERLFITESTVKGHVQHIIDKLGARDRTEALAIGTKRGIIQL